MKIPIRITINGSEQALGRFMNHNYAEYHVPVNADVQGIDVIFVDERDDIVNPPKGAVGWHPPYG